MSKLFSPLLIAAAVAAANAGASEADYHLEPVVFPEKDLTSGGPSNQFPRAKGVYNGLIMPTDRVVAEQSGFFNLTIFSDRDFRGRMNIGSDVTPLRGHFDRQGETAVLIYRKVWDDCFCFYTLRLVWVVDLELIAGTDQIQGTIANARRGWSTSLFGYRGYGSVDGPAPEAGRYTWHVAGSDDPAAAPAGEGYGAVTVDSRGRLKIGGALADNTKFSRSAVISTNGWWPFYLELSDGRGTLMGWLNFSSLVSSDVAGDLLWVKPRRDDRQFYPDGFSGTVAAQGARYSAPSSTGLPLSWTNGILRISGGNLPAALTNRVAWLAGGTLSDQGGGISGLTFSLVRGTGVFRGKFVHPVNGRRTSYSGVVDQLEDVGVGFFLGTDQGGLVRLEGAP